MFSSRALYSCHRRHIHITHNWHKGKLTQDEGIVGQYISHTYTCQSITHTLAHKYSTQTHKLSIGIFVHGFCMNTVRTEAYSCLEDSLPDTDTVPERPMTNTQTDTHTHTHRHTHRHTNTHSLLLSISLFSLKKNK